MNQNKEKLEAKLYQQYSEAQADLERGNIAQGQQSLEELLKEEILQREEYSNILYGIYQSLAQILAQSEKIKDNCQSLYYFNKSALIQSDWKTDRSAAMVFRKIGLIPKACNYILRALSNCSLKVLHPLILQEACILFFLMNDQNQFEKYYKMFPSQEPIQQEKAKQIKEFFDRQIASEFVEQLIEERKGLQEKLKILPMFEEETHHFEQNEKVELKINIYDGCKLLDKIKNLLKYLLEIPVKHKEKQFEEKQISSTMIIIGQKSVNKGKKNQKACKEQIKECKDKDKEPTKQSERQREKNQKKQQNEPYNLDQFIYSSRRELSDLVTLKFGQSDFLQTVSDLPQKQVTEIKEISECPIARNLLSNLKPQYLTVIHLLEDIQNIILSQMDPENSVLVNAQKKLISCFVWEQHFTNIINQNPKIVLRILQIAYDKFQLHKKSKKPKTPKSQQKVENYILLITKLKQYLLFECNVEEYLNISEKQQYFREFNKLMAQIHTDVNFFQSKLAKYCAKQLEDPDIYEQVRRKVRSIKFNTQDVAPTQSQSMSQISEILEQFEQMEQSLEFTEKVVNQFDIMYETMKTQINLEIIKRIVKICLNQYYFSNSREQLKQIYSKLNEHQLPNRFLELIISPDIALSLMCLKYALILIHIDDYADFMRIFLLGLLNSNNEDTYLILNQIFKLPKLNLLKIFDRPINKSIPKLIKPSLLIDEILIVFIQIRIKMRERFQSFYQFLLNYFNDDLELGLYMISQINFNDKNDKVYEIKKRDFEEEKQILDSQYDDPTQLSEQEEDEFQLIECYTHNFIQITLNNEQLQDKFKLNFKLYQLELASRKIIANCDILINLGCPAIIDQIKRYCKEQIKIEFSLSTKQLMESIRNIFQFYYFTQSQFEFSLIELQFFGYFLPLLIKQKDIQQDCWEFIHKLNLLEENNQQIMHFNEQFYEIICGNEIVKKKEEQIQIFKELNYYQCLWKSNLLILKAQWFNQSDQMPELKDQIQSIRLIIHALAYNNSQHIWEYLYTILYQYADQMFNEKNHSGPDWFISQKKVFSMISRADGIQNPFIEHQFIMDLLKLHQRHLKYQLQPNQQKYEAVQQIVNNIYEKEYKPEIPTEIKNVKANVRKLILLEKIVVRQLNNIEIPQIRTHLENLEKLKILIERIQDQDNKYYFNGREYKMELTLDIYISLYICLKRFFKNKQQQKLLQLIDLIKQLYPDLLIDVQNQIEFHFQQATKLFKINKNEKQAKITVTKECQIILNNLLNQFGQFAAKFNKKKVPRYIVQAIYYQTQMIYSSNLPKEKAYETMLQIYQTNSKDMVYYYKIFDKYVAEKDEIMRLYYNHDQVFMAQKSKILKLVIQLLVDLKKWKELIQLMDKFYKQNYDQRLLQVSNELTLKQNFQQIQDIQLVKELLRKLELYKKQTDIGKLLPAFDELYGHLYQISQTMDQEPADKHVQLGKKMMEEYKQTKKKTKKETQSQIPA